MSFSQLPCVIIQCLRSTFPVTELPLCKPFCMEPPYSSSHSYNSSMKMTIPASHHADIDRSSSELRALDCNLTSLCDHIQMEGFNSGTFSDIVVHASGSTYNLHRLILSRSSYFRNMLHGPWKEATSPVVTLHVDDKNVNGEAIAMALAYMYGHQPKLTDNNAFRVLAAASFLDLQDLCGICTDFIIAELWTSNFLEYQVFAENQDYGIHGDRVRSACWGYLCQSGAMELKEVLPKLSAQTLHALLTSDELWVSSEEKRFELALHTFLIKGSLSKSVNSEQGGCSFESGSETLSKNSKAKDIFVIDSCNNTEMESELGHLSLKDTFRLCDTAQNLLVEFPGRGINSQKGISNSKQQMQQPAYLPPNLDPKYSCNIEGSSLLNSSYSDNNGVMTSCSSVDIAAGVGVSGLGANGVAVEGPSEEGSCYELNNNAWLPGIQPGHFSAGNSSSDGQRQNDWGSCGMHALSWGGRVVGRRQLKNHAKGSFCVLSEEYETFDNIFEGGSLLYSNMSFEALLNVRKQLEELDFPCKAVNDGLWLQMLLSQRVQEIGSDTCKNCCLTSMMCACRQPYSFSRGVESTGYYVNEHGQNNSGNLGNIYVTDSVPGETNGLVRPVRVHVRGAVEGLAGIGRGTTFVPASAWPPTRFVFSRGPFGMGNRNSQPSLANDDSDARTDLNGELSGDGLTALVGLSQGGTNLAAVQGEQTERGYEIDNQSRVLGASVAGPSTSGIPMQIQQSTEHALGIEWESGSSSISLDVRTPLSHFPPFRFGVQFEYVHRLGDGQVKHSPEFFYAGSLWKISVQAFGDEDPQGRRTLGLFLHRRKAETIDPHRKVMYVDSREKVTARYQLICPSKREVLVFGNYKQTGTLLPKAPKGWGWRTAILFDELIDLLQNGCLRVAVVVQLV